MDWFDTISLAQTNLWRSKARTILTLLAISIGAITITLTLALGEGSKVFLASQLGGMVQENVMTVYPVYDDGSGDNDMSSGEQQVGNPFDNTPQEYKAQRHRTNVPDQATMLQGAIQQAMQPLTINEEKIREIRKIPEVLDVFEQKLPYVSYLQHVDSKKYRAQIVDVVFRGYNKTSLSAGKIPSPTDMENVVIGYQYLPLFGFQDEKSALGEQITVAFANQSGGYRRIKMTISGVTTKSIGSPSLLVSYSMADKISRLQNRNNPFVALTVVLKPDINQTQAQAVQKNIEKMRLLVHYDQQGVDATNSMINIIQYILLGFGAIALLAAMIGIVNTLLMAVFERTREIGLMKALGMRNSGIFSVFLAEAGVIGFLGGAFGVVAALGIGEIGNMIISHYLMKGYGDVEIILFTLPTMALVLAGATLIGCLAGTIPAIKASRLNPVDALRYE